MALSRKSRTAYSLFNPVVNAAKVYYFSILQLHPIDLTLSFTPTGRIDLNPTSKEMAILGLISQLDGVKVQLNALITEHASGTGAMITSILIKHYKSSFLRQIHTLVGSSDLIEGSVGFVANLGTGVYDLFYEPIEGLLDSNGSFLNGLSKGGKSLATRTIGGGAAQVSKVTGGIGAGISMLTMDGAYRDKRTLDKMKKTTSMSEGVYVGAKELGTNIYEGVTGLAAMPYVNM